MGHAGHLSDMSIPRQTRRAVVAGGLAAGLLTSRIAQAQSPPARVKGPAVWLDMDQKELDDAYDQRVYAPNQDQVNGRRAVNSEAVRKRLGFKRAAYGSAPIEMLDIYTTSRSNAPVNVFVHGGAWRGGMAKEYGAPAEVLVNAGAHFVVLDFSNVDETGGDLMPMAEQIRRGIAWVARNAASFGGDPNRIFISGHSSGAHLAGTALIADWEKDFGLPQTFIKGALLCSGMYDLKPARLSARSKYVKFTDAMEDALSTQRHLARIATPLVLAHGTFETPEFKRQSQDFQAALAQAGKTSRLLVGSGYNHFEMIETLANPYGLLGHAMLAQMELAPA